MKLATFDYKGETRIGVVTDKGIVDLAAAAPSLPPDMVARLTANRALFPRGVDLILTAKTRRARSGIPWRA